MNKQIDRLRAIIEIGKGDDLLALFKAILTGQQGRQLVQGMRDIWIDHLTEEGIKRVDYMTGQIQTVQNETGSTF